MTERPSITVDALIRELLDAQAITHRDLASLLGEGRHNVSLNQLEMAVVNAELVSNATLLVAIAAVSGQQVLDDVNPVVRADLLSRRVAKRAGALAIAHPSIPTVAFVEDSEDNLALVAAELGRADFQVVLCTAPQFQMLLSEAYPVQNEDSRRACEDIYEILDEAVRTDASDVHLGVDIPPMLRINSTLTPLNRQPLTSGWLYAQIAELIGEERMVAFRQAQDVDVAVAYGDARFRVNVGQDRSGPIVAARRLPVSVPSPEQLGLPLSVRKMIELDRGLVLVTGPTGSGKSTTLASLLTAAMAHPTRGRHLITLEDPVEYIIPAGAASLVRQRELGRDFQSFPSALRQALRQDPDVIFIGELRDPETARTAIQAAETGHLVFGTLHTYDAASSVARMVGQFPEGEQDQVRSQLAYVLKGVVSQTLLPRRDGRGRLAAYEVLVGTPAVANNLRRTDGATAIRQVLETGAADGMQSMDEALAAAVRSGVVSREEALSRARDVDDFLRRVDRRN